MHLFLEGINDIEAAQSNFFFFFFTIIFTSDLGEEVDGREMFGLEQRRN